MTVIILLLLFLMTMLYSCLAAKTPYDRKVDDEQQEKALALYLKNKESSK